MTYTVILTDQAERELEQAADWWATHRSAEEARRWYLGITEAIEGLAGNPYRCALAWENDEFPFEIRELHFGLGSRPTHRAVFTILDDLVVVASVRHTAQDRLTPDDVDLN